MGLKSALSKGFSKVGNFLKTVGGGSAVAGTVVATAGLLCSLFVPPAAAAVILGVPLMTIGGGLWGTGAISNEIAKTLA